LPVWRRRALRWISHVRPFPAGNTVPLADCTPSRPVLGVAASPLLRKGGRDSPVRVGEFGALADPLDDRQRFDRAQPEATEGAARHLQCQLELSQHGLAGTPLL